MTNPNPSALPTLQAAHDRLAQVADQCVQQSEAWREDQTILKKDVRRAIAKRQKTITHLRTPPRTARLWLQLRGTDWRLTLWRALHRAILRARAANLRRRLTILALICAAGPIWAYMRLVRFARSIRQKGRQAWRQAAAWYHHRAERTRARRRDQMARGQQVIQVACLLLAIELVLLVGLLVVVIVY